MIMIIYSKRALKYCVFEMIFGFDHHFGVSIHLSVSHWQVYSLHEKKRRNNYK